MNDLLLRACRGESLARPPVWLMRQAGRFLPEYRALRARYPFLTLLTTPELATEVTLQPVEILGVDAAIIFSDILVVPAALGQRLRVDDGVGPRLDPPIRGAADLERLRPIEVEESLPYLTKAIRLTRSSLDGKVPLIGFAGGPWTLAWYMIEGSGLGASAPGARHSALGTSVAARLLEENPALIEALLERLTDAVGDLLEAEARAGAQVLQVFESAASALSPDRFRSVALPHLARVIERAGGTGCPVIAFAPGAGWALEDLARKTLADVIGVDRFTDAVEARNRLPRNVLQGNLDPEMLLTSPDQIRRETLRMIAAFSPSCYIANLGHGVLPNTPVPNVQAFVDAVQSFNAAGQ